MNKATTLPLDLNKHIQACALHTTIATVMKYTKKAYM